LPEKFSILFIMKDLAEPLREAMARTDAPLLEIQAIQTPPDKTFPFF
jgi:hypothetical protein